MKQQTVKTTNQTVLIETYWNVNGGASGKDRCSQSVLIETYWNVKVESAWSDRMGVWY